MTLTNIKTVTDKTGKTRRYLRVKGHPLVALPDLPPDDPSFISAWAEALKQIKGRAVKPSQGSIAMMCAAFLRSSDYLTKSAGYRSILLRHASAIEDAYGQAQARHLAPRHIAADLSKLAPSVAASRFKAWRAICGYGLSVNILKADPTEGVKRPQIPVSEGHPAWTAEDVAKFRARWPIGTVQRALFEVLHWTGARISDAVLIGPGMVDRDGVLRFRQEKTGGLAYVPWTNALPDYAGDMDADRQMMHAALRCCAGHMTFLATQDGQTRSAKAIGGDVAKAARLAGVSKSAHGLRKTRATVLAEAGATVLQISAWTGHESLSEVAHYTKSAERRKAVMGQNKNGTLANDPIQLANSGENRAKS